MRGRKTPSLPETEVDGSLAAFQAAYLHHLQMRGYSAETVEDRRRELYHFIGWAASEGLSSPVDVTKEHLQQYQSALFERRKPDGAPLSFRTQLVKLTRIRGFFRWLARDGHIAANPAAELELPRVERKLPSTVLSAPEADRILAQPNLGDPVGLRDRAILELLYATGLRRSEIVRLGLGDIDEARGVLVVRQGKGKKDRIVPIGARALSWASAYREKARPALASGGSSDTLFLSQSGAPLAPQKLSDRVSAYVTRAGVGKRGSCHLFRHTAATLMLEGGADIRFIQAYLGHESLQTTQVYTRVSVAKLLEVHATTHPSARGG